jgi:hypothetical protein
MSSGVGVIPNASDVYAVVKRKWEDSGEKNIGYVRLQMVSANDYRGMPNFVKEKIGKEIDTTVSKQDLDFFKHTVNVLVSFVGDEKQQQQFYTARIKPKDNS